MPSGSPGDMLRCLGGTDWEVVTGDAGDLLLSGGEGVGWEVLPKPGGPALFVIDGAEIKWLELESTYPAVVAYNPGADPAFEVVQPSSEVPAVLCWNPAVESGKLSFVEIGSQFKYIGRDEFGALVGDYVRAF